MITGCAAPGGGVNTPPKGLKYGVSLAEWSLHKTLFAGFPGRIFVSLWGIVLLVLIVAGVVVHHRRWPDAARIRSNFCRSAKS